LRVVRGCFRAGRGSFWLGGGAICLARKAPKPGAPGFEVGAPEFDGGARGCLGWAGEPFWGVRRVQSLVRDGIRVARRVLEACAQGVCGLRVGLFGWCFRLSGWCARIGGRRVGVLG
jgi:hypothetical protein